MFALTATRSSAVDALRHEHASAAIQVLGVIGFALLTVLGAQVRIYLWEVPFTLQTLVVYGSGLYLGWRNGMLAQILYLMIGLFMPVYAGDGFGLAYFYAAPTAGYLLAYPLAAALVGLLSKRWNTLAGSTLTLIAGSLVVFACGVTWLHFAAGHETWAESIEKGWLRFIPVDLAKIMLVSLLYSGSRKL
jgi:biotin transport system substrate-specific component